MRRIALVGLAALGMAACSGSSGASSPAAPVPAAHVAASTTSHVVVVVMENKERGSVIGSRSAPYMNSLARRGQAETGVVIPTTDAEAFIRGSAEAGVLRILQ